MYFNSALQFNPWIWLFKYQYLNGSVWGTLLSISPQMYAINIHVLTYDVLYRLFTGKLVKTGY